MSEAASPTAVIADGSTTSTITVTLKDSSGTPVPGEGVTLAKTSGPGTPVINPKLTFLSDAMKPYWERCLSLPGLYGQVPRYTEVQLDAVGLDGTPYRWKTRGFVARLLQHEYDHLDGILYPMRMADMTTFGFVSELGTPAYPPLPFDREDFADPEIG